MNLLRLYHRLYCMLNVLWRRGAAVCVCVWVCNVCALSSLFRRTCDLSYSAVGCKSMYLPRSGGGRVGPFQMKIARTNSVPSPTQQCINGRRDVLAAGPFLMQECSSFVDCSLGLPTMIWNSRGGGPLQHWMAICQEKECPAFNLQLEDLGHRSSLLGRG